VNLIMEEAIRVMRDAGATIIRIADPALDAEELIDANSVDVYEFKDLFERYLASVPGAPVGSLADIIASGTCHESSLEFLIASENLAEGVTHPEYKRRLGRNQDVRRRLSSIFDGNGLDAIVYPLQKRLVVPLAEPDQVDRNGVLAAVSGFPAITVPVGFSQPTSAAPIGVPVGMDILGRPWSEANLIRLAYSYEQASLHRRPPMSTPQL
jgi:amidase